MSPRNYFYRLKSNKRKTNTGVNYKINEKCNLLENFNENILGM